MKAEAFKYFEIRKDSAVHVSLSSSSLVKQPGTRGPLSHWEHFAGTQPEGSFPKTSLDDK
jgi:hypothetical protein